MNYLYALMGMAMISGIMYMLEISTSISKQGLFSKAPEDMYFKTESPIVDKAFLTVLSNNKSKLREWPIGAAFCEQLKSESAKISPLVLKYDVQGRSNSNHERFLNSCTLLTPNHRVVISYRYPNIDTYGLYSCLQSNASSSHCRFED